MHNLTNIKQRKSITRYVNEQMKESLITAGFLYQTYAFLESFLKYETVQNFRIEHPTEFMAPAVTFCHKNRINRELFCEAFPEECFWYETREDFCNAAPKLCDLLTNYLNLGVPRKISQKYHNISNEFLDAYGPQSPWDNINFSTQTSCKSQRNGYTEYCNVNDSILIQAPSGGFPYKCFSIFSLLDKPNEEPRKISFIDGYSFVIHTYPTQLMDYKSNVQLYMYVHDPRRIANPIAEGITLNGGYRYTFSFKMQQIQNLPPPYNTYCVDYVKKWKENGGRGPLTKKDCIELCKIERMMEQNHCVGKGITYPHRFPICSEITTMSDRVVQNCSLGCREACDVTLYIIARKHEKDETEQRKAGVIFLSLKFGQLSVQRIFMDPKFQNIELFSYIGGFMGLWLGICLVTFVDFLETVTDVMTFAVMKWKKMHRKNIIRPRLRY